MVHEKRIGTKGLAEQYTQEERYELAFECYEQLIFDIDESDRVETFLALAEIYLKLKNFGIESFKNNRPSKLSGGEKQRVALAGVMVKDIKLLLLDEPTGSLDYDNRTVIWNLISQLKIKNLTIIVVSHDESISNFTDVSHKLENGTIKQFK